MLTYDVGVIWDHMCEQLQSVFTQLTLSAELFICYHVLSGILTPSYGNSIPSSLHMRMYVC